MQQLLLIWTRLMDPFIKNPAFFQQLRTTCIVKRRYEPPLESTHRPRRLRNRYRVYETVQDHKTPVEPMKVTLLLQKYVGDLGRPGEIVTVEDKKARLILLTKSGTYLSEDNLAESKKHEQQESYSSKFAGATVAELEKFILSVIMNKEVPWTIEPWHIKAAFRKSLVNVPEYAITLPERPISGPDLNIENREFCVTVKINNKETAKVRCRIHHWATDIYERLPVVKKHREKPAELLFPEDSAHTM